MRTLQKEAVGEDMPAARLDEVARASGQVAETSPVPRHRGYDDDEELVLVSWFPLWRVVERKKQLPDGSGVWVREVRLAHWVVWLVIIMVIGLLLDQSFGWIGKAYKILKLIAVFIAKWAGYQF